MYKYLFSFFFIIIFSTQCTNKVYLREDLDSLFKKEKLEGCFALLQNRTGELQVYNMTWYKDTILNVGRIADIFLSLVAVEEGSIDNANTKIDFAQKTLTFQEAFNNEKVPLSDILQLKINKDYLQRFMDTLQYGKSTLNTPKKPKAFYSSIDEQLGLVKKMYFNQLPFQERTTKVVRSLFQLDKQGDWEWHYKYSRINNTHQKSTSHWLIGWVEQKHHVSFFVFYAVENRNDTNTFSPIRFVKDISKNIISDNTNK